MLFSFFRSSKKLVAHSAINGDISIGKSYGNRTLFASNIPQSGGELTWMWKKVTKDIQSRMPDVKNCLMLGIGAGTMIQTLRSAFPKITITGVDIDPVIVAVAKEQFGILEDKQTKFIIANAKDWTTTAPTKQKFDLIVVDLYIADINPAFSHTKSFLQNVKDLLVQNGIIIFNCDYQEEKKEEFENFYDTCSHFFLTVEDIFQYRKNHILLLRR